MLVGASMLLIEAAAAATNDSSLAQYQAILDRAPFGSVTGTPSAGPLAGWATDFAFCGRVSMTNGQELAVIQKKSENRAYYKGEGETIGDVKIVRIEDGPPVAKLVLQRGLETANLECQAVAGGPATAGPPRPGMPMAGAPQPGMPGAPMPGQPPNVRRIPFRRGVQ